MPASTLSKIDPNNPVAIARLIALKGAVKLEATGMKHSSGKSMRRLAARELGLVANASHDTVIGALNREIEKRTQAAAAAPTQEQQT